MRRAGAGARRPPGPSRGERGHLLLVLMVAITVMLIMLTVAAQSWTFRMRREMEAELIFRGEQYITGLEIWRDKTGGFPVGDLDVLIKKGPDGARTMRKLYKNPLNKEGKWQYLLLHPNGQGYINPCANTGPDAFAAQSELTGQIPVGGLSLGGGQPGSSPMISGGTVIEPARNIPGQGKRGRMGGPGNGGGIFGDLGSMDSELFEKTVKGMNLAIVGVVNCQQEASIRTYQGQAWLSNWAFTPLTQGEFGGRATPGHLTGGKVNIPSGLGMTGAQVYTDPAALKGHGGGLVTGRAEPDKRPSRGVLGDSRGRAAWEQDKEDDEDERYDYQWRRGQNEDEEEDEEDDWRLRRWRRDRERLEDEESRDEEAAEEGSRDDGEDSGDEAGDDEDEGDGTGGEDDGGDDEDDGGGDEDDGGGDEDDGGDDEDDGGEDGEEDDDGGVANLI